MTKLTRDLADGRKLSVVVKLLSEKVIVILKHNESANKVAINIDLLTVPIDPCINESKGDLKNVRDD